MEEGGRLSLGKGETAPQRASDLFQLRDMKMSTVYTRERSKCPRRGEGTSPKELETKRELAFPSSSFELTSPLTPSVPVQLL